MSIPHAAELSASSVDPDAIEQAICKKYTGVAVQATGYFAYSVGREGAQLLNYDPALLAEVPESQLQSFCGVGNPCSIQPIPAGCVVVDIGCGCGFDCYVASRAIGSSGHVTGIDITEAMVVRARENMAVLDASNVEILHGNGIDMPIEDTFADVVISNGVFNLAPDKELLFAEIFRILKPGGRLQFADIILVRELPPDLAASAESWSQ